MFFPSLLVLGLASSVLANPHRRAPGLTVDISGPPPTVNSVSSLQFKAVVRNNGAEDLRILKYGTILDDRLPTRSFTITKEGRPVPFTGVKINLNLNALDQSAFTVIPAGQSVTVNHDVSALFDFSSAGPGIFSFRPTTNFRVLATNATLANGSGSVNFGRVEATASNMVIRINGDIRRRELPQVHKRAVNTCTERQQRIFVDNSYTEGQSLARYGASYIRANGANELFQSYWGNGTATDQVLSVLDAVANENSDSRTLGCVDEFNVCTGGVIAYTVIDTTNIYFCDIFFQEVPTISVCSTTSVNNRDTRSGTMLHELTHAVSDTEDFSYGCEANQELQGAQALANADSYNCFAMQVYRNTKCS